jgi:hypothetical protein
MRPQKAVYRRFRSYCHFAKLRHIEGFTYVKAFIQICLTSTLFYLINKTGAYHINAFKYPYNFFIGIYCHYIDIHFSLGRYRQKKGVEVKVHCQT